jgi:hypothetical protein
MISTITFDTINESMYTGLASGLLVLVTVWVITLFFTDQS